jgi:hypothetical protein
MKFKYGRITRKKCGDGKRDTFKKENSCLRAPILFFAGTPVASIDP